MWKGVQKGIKDLNAVKDIIIAKYPETANHKHIIWIGSWRLVDNAIEKGIELGELVEKPPAAVDTTAATTPTTLPTNTPTTPPTNTAPASDKVPGSLVGDLVGKVEAEPQKPTSPASSQKPEFKLIIPESVPETPPVPVIDDLIRRGYRSREDLEAIMKENFKGRAYRDEIRERLELFKDRQPPFNDIAVTPPTTLPTNTPTIPPTNTPTIPPTNTPTIPPLPGQNGQNTGNLPGIGDVVGGVAGGVPGSVAATSAPDRNQIPAASPPSTSITPEQVSEWAETMEATLKTMAEMAT
jgi:hypothetical protein